MCQSSMCDPPAIQDECLTVTVEWHCECTLPLETRLKCEETCAWACDPSMSIGHRMIERQISTLPTAAVTRVRAGILHVTQISDVNSHVSDSVLV